MNKKGAGEDVWIIISIVVGVIALVLIAVGFTTGWENLSSKFNLLSGGKGTLSSVAESCAITCGKQSAGLTAWCEGFDDPIKGLTEKQLTDLVGKITMAVSPYNGWEKKQDKIFGFGPKDPVSGSATPCDPSLAAGATATTPGLNPCSGEVIKIKKNGDKFDIISGASCGSLYNAGLIKFSKPCDLIC